MVIFDRDARLPLTATIHRYLPSRAMLATAGVGP